MLTPENLGLHSSANTFGDLHRALGARLLHEDGEFLIDNGRTVILERGKTPGEYVTAAHWDLAIALDHLTLAAVEEGLGTCWIGSVYADQVKEILGIPENIRFVQLLTLGYPAKTGGKKNRKSLEEIVKYEQWTR